MAYQANFKRYEIKYMITQQQKEILLTAMKPYMTIDRYGRTTIKNIYYDTDTYLLIRRSIEKPVYKEKLRIRCYGKLTNDTPVFVELKKKFKHVVYKRRVSMPEHEATQWLNRECGCKNPTQISAEIDYFIDYYKNLHPTLLLSYEREAYYSNDNSDFRVTFDENILCRQDNLSLKSETYGTPILNNGSILMEIKCSGGIPLWMTSVLSKEHIFKIPFSKYGTAYRTIIFPQLQKLSMQKTKEA